MLVCTMTSASDFDPLVMSKGKLSNLEFYKLVSCGAEPGGACVYGTIKWDVRRKGAISIGIIETEAGFPARLKQSADTALDKAISEVNQLGAGVSLVKTTSGTPDIRIRLTTALDTTDTRELRTEADVGLALGTTTRVYVARTRNGIINHVDMTITQEVGARHLNSMMLSNTVASLGLMTHTSNRVYRDRSVFSILGRKPTRLRGQDAMVVKTHYPR